MVIIPVVAVCVAGAGTVDSVSVKECMVTLTDNGTTYGDSVTVTDSSGKELGSGELVIHEPLEITGTSGTVSAVNVSENASVSEGTALLTLEGSANETQYQELLAKREARTVTLKKLIQLKADPEIKAEISGTVQSVNISAGSSTSTDSSSGSSSNSSSSGSSGISVSQDGKSISFQITFPETAAVAEDVKKEDSGNENPDTADNGSSTDNDTDGISDGTDSQQGSDSGQDDKDPTSSNENTPVVNGTDSSG